MDMRVQENRWVNTGVLPRGAQVALTAGRRENPDSSWKTIQAPRRRAPLSVEGSPVNRIGVDVGAAFPGMAG